MDFLKLSISQPFEELQGWHLELKLITPIYITGCHCGTMATIWDFLWWGGGIGGRRPPIGPKGPPQPL